MAWLLAGLAVSGGLGQLRAATLPSGFVEETVGSGWTGLAGLTFAQDGRMFVWERAGKVWIVENGVKSATPFLDISHEVGGWRDFGLLGFALHPNFTNNGHVYLYYVVDHHHLIHFGTPNYNTATNEYYMATQGRITRYTARASDGFRSIDPDSRKVLLGETPGTGPAILHESHGTGMIVFGTDGTLLASSGDGASYSSTDIGNAGETYYQRSLNEGIIVPKQNVGAYRSQLVDSMNGKVLRLDPESGDGVPSNPFYDPANPRAARSRVWALGLRNPCRMALKPGTGSHDPADANPGALYIGDVGYQTWEDLQISDGPGQNFGWPAFEGLTAHSGYYGANVPNRDAPNPLYNGGSCAQQFFYFRELIKQDSLNPPSWPNSCNTSQQIPATIPRFVHKRPALDWRHGQTLARTGIYSNNQALVINVGASGSPVAGSMFPGNCSIGGAWYTNTHFPELFRNTYFQADYGAAWIKSFVFDANHKPTAVQNFATAAGSVVFVTVEPRTGHLYYIAWSTTLRRVRYTASANQAPTAVAAVDRNFGPGPLTVQFSSAGSSDPEGQTLGYSWYFGDGAPLATLSNPSHTFNAPAGVPTPYTVTLVVTDAGGLKATNQVLVSVNNTPPQVTITSPVDGTHYPLTGDTVYHCTALITDAEHSAGQRTCSWQTFLHHNDHQHEEAAVQDCTTTTVLSPVGCNGETFYYRVVLTVTDAAGLATTREVRLYPDCPGLAPEIVLVQPVNQEVFPEGAMIPFEASINPNGWAIARVQFLVNNQVAADTVAPPYQLDWGPAAAGDYSVSARVLYDTASAVTSGTVTVHVVAAPEAPGGFTASAVASSQIDLLWTPPPGPIDGYDLERAVHGAAFAPIASLNAGTTGYSDAGLTHSTRYDYRLWARNGGGRSLTPAVAQAITPTWQSVLINFQPAAAPVPPGYLPDTGAVFGNRANGFQYGWNANNSANTYDRNSTRSPDQRYDTTVATQEPGGGSVWELALPNGQYGVRLVAGDPARFNGVFYQFQTEGVTMLSGAPSSNNRWVTGSNVVTVADGRLTVSNGPDASANKLCFIDVHRLAIPFANVRLTILQWTPSGAVTLRVEGNGDLNRCSVEGSRDFLLWTPFPNPIQPDGTITFQDPSLPAGLPRFYRVVCPAD